MSLWWLKDKKNNKLMCFEVLHDKCYNYCIPTDSMIYNKEEMAWAEKIGELALTCTFSNFMCEVLFDENYDLCLADGLYYTLKNDEKMFGVEIKDNRCVKTWWITETLQDDGIAKVFKEMFSDPDNSKLAIETFGTYLHEMEEE